MRGITCSLTLCDRAAICDARAGKLLSTDVNNRELQHYRTSPSTTKRNVGQDSSVTTDMCGVSVAASDTENRKRFNIKIKQSTA
jgi:hypothetical protein